MGIFGPPDIKKMRAKNDIKGIISLLSHSKDFPLITEVTSTLREIGSPAVGPLIVALKDKNPNVREGAARTFIGLKDVRALEPLIATLKDEMAYVRTAAVMALMYIGDPGAVEPLIVALKDEVRVARLAASALGTLGDARAIEPLFAALKRDPEGSQTYYLSLGQIGDVRAIEPLIIMLNDQSSVTRKSAAMALGKLGDARTIEPLSALLKADNKDVREAAIKALEKNAGPQQGRPVVVENAVKDDVSIEKQLWFFGDYLAYARKEEGPYFTPWMGDTDSKMPTYEIGFELLRVIDTQYFSARLSNWRVYENAEPEGWRNRDIIDINARYNTNYILQVKTEHNLSRNVQKSEKAFLFTTADEVNAFLRQELNADKLQEILSDAAKKDSTFANKENVPPKVE
jgi:HEAT repeat protein